MGSIDFMSFKLTGSKRLHVNTIECKLQVRSGRSYMEIQQNIFIFPKFRFLILERRGVGVKQNEIKRGKKKKGKGEQYINTIRVG